MIEHILWSRDLRYLTIIVETDIVKYYVIGLLHYQSRLARIYRIIVDDGSSRIIDFNTCIIIEKLRVVDSYPLWSLYCQSFRIIKY